MSRIEHIQAHPASAGSRPSGHASACSLSAGMAEPISPTS